MKTHILVGTQPNYPVLLRIDSILKVEPSKNYYEGEEEDNLCYITLTDGELIEVNTSFDALTLELAGA